MTMQKICFGAVQLARPVTETPKGLVGHFWITDPDLEKTRMARQARTTDGVAYATMRWTPEGDRFDCLTARLPMDTGNFVESALTIATLAPMPSPQKRSLINALSRLYQSVDRFHQKAVMTSPDPSQQANAIMGQNGLLNALDNASQIGVTLGLPEDTELETLYEQHFDGKQGSDIRSALKLRLKTSALQIFNYGGYGKRLS